MVKREFLAQVVDDFKTNWISETAKYEGTSVVEVEASYRGEDLEKLHSRISGKTVTIVENEYQVGENDFFEKEDDNFVLHRSLFTEI